MKDDAAIKIKREEALGMVTASMAVILQIYDLALSAEIITDAKEKYGDLLVDTLMNDLISSGYMTDLKTLPSDILKQRAMLSIMTPLPQTWMKTRN